MLDFPNSPTIGQIFSNATGVYRWDGTKWMPTASGGAVIAIRVFTASSTYTPTPGMQTCLIECVGGGGGANGYPGAAGVWSGAAGGGSGGYSRKFCTAAQIGASQTVTVGAGGAGGPSSGGAGGNGTATSVGSLCIANGGSAAPGTVVAGAGAAAGTGDLALPGSAGMASSYNSSAATVSVIPTAGLGGNSFFGGVGLCGQWAGNGVNSNGGNSTSGSGGSGGFSGGGAIAGGAGGAGIAVITEYSVAQGGPPGSGFSTGDVKLTFKTVADLGWVMMNDGTIGDASSGATTANANTVNLFALFYNNCADADVPVQTSAGAATTRAAQGTAATAYGNHCRLVLPLALGRDLAVAGAGAGLTARTLGSNAGAETHTQVLGELVNHNHTPGALQFFQGGTPNNANPYYPNINNTNSTANAQSNSVNNLAAGSGGAMSILNPRVHLNVMVCL